MTMLPSIDMSAKFGVMDTPYGQEAVRRPFSAAVVSSNVNNAPTHSRHLISFGIEPFMIIYAFMGF
jgi:hypothetical protein